ncbi:MAG: hypothetical protein HZA15_08120 [Nitrospirae bacterium]|nr:hypothetical protein [Nitrospirota bacterium]
MIDRRVFLKGIVGAGITPDLLQGLRLNATQTDRSKFLDRLQSAENTLVVKIDEVIVHEATAWMVDDLVMGKDIQFDVCGRCLMGYEPVPIEASFFTDADKMRSPNPDDFKAGSIYLMTGGMYLYEERFCLHMLSPKFKQIETVLSPQEIDEVKRWFDIGGYPKSSMNQPEGK